MTDYISREAAMNLVDHYWGQAYNAGYFDAAVRLGGVFRELEDIPAADVRPVVLCRDCEYYQADCGWCGLLDIGMNVNAFCSLGVKREES